MYKAFHISDVLSVTTGVLLTDRHMEGVQEVFDHMVGFNTFTHELPTLFDPVAAEIFRQYHEMEWVVVPEWVDREVEIPAFIAECEARFGRMISLEQMAEQPERVDFFTARENAKKRLGNG